jgi:hypothetical protein
MLVTMRKNQHKRTGCLPSANQEFESFLNLFQEKAQLTETLEKRNVGPVIPASVQAKALNAENVTNIALGFLKRIGNKSNLKPKRVTLEENLYVVEVEMKKLSAVVRVDSESHEIRGYEIQSKTEEASSASFSTRMLLVIVGVAAAVHILLNFLFRIFGF